MFEFVFETHSNSYAVKRTSIKEIEDIFADATSEPEASEQVSSSNSYWALKVRFYFRFSDQNALLLTDQNASLLTDQNALHA